MLTVVILAWSSSKISYQSNVCGKCHEKSKFMKGWRSYYGELLWGLLESTGAALARLHQHPTRTDAATPLTCIHATFFFLLGADSRRFVTNRADSSGNGRYSPISAETGCHHVAGLHSSASCGLEREREGRRDKDATSCALTWNYDAESKVESCGVDRFLNRCIGV